MDRPGVALRATPMLMETQESETVTTTEAELGLSSSVVSKILSGVIRPQLSDLLMIA
jgi:hypothetical protein